MTKKTDKYEDYSRDESCVSFAVKHWVKRNSFVEQYASWRVQTETFFVAIDASTRGFGMYNGGVFTGKGCSNNMDHAVLAVGWKKVNG